MTWQELSDRAFRAMAPETPAGDRAYQTMRLTIANGPNATSGGLHGAMLAFALNEVERIRKEGHTYHSNAKHRATFALACRAFIACEEAEPRS